MPAAGARSRPAFAALALLWMGAFSHAGVFSGSFCRRLAPRFFLLGGVIYLFSAGWLYPGIFRRAVGFFAFAFLAMGAFVPDPTSVGFFYTQKQEEEFDEDNKTGISPAVVFSAARLIPPPGGRGKPPAGGCFAQNRRGRKSEEPAGWLYPGIFRLRFSCDGRFCPWPDFGRVFLYPKIKGGI